MGLLKTVMQVQALVLLIYGLPQLLVPASWTALTQQVPLPEDYVLRAIGISFLVLAYLEIKIVADLERYRALSAPYFVLPALFAATIGVQALFRGFSGAAWYWWLNGIVAAVFAIAVWIASRRG